MKLILYTNTAETNRLDKTNSLTALTTEIDVEPVNDFDVLNPVFSLVSPSTYYNNANYCYSSTLGRFYFIRKTTILSGNRLQFECEIDVLNTYKNQILNLTVTAARSTNKYNKYIQDNQQLTTNKPINQLKVLPNKPFNPSAIMSGSSKCFVVALGKG